MLFFDDEGTENGGLIFAGKQGADGKIMSGVSLTFDRYRQDQQLQLMGQDHGGRHFAGLTVNDVIDGTKYPVFGGTHKEGEAPQSITRRLYVGKQAQGLGLGTKLLKISLDWMEAHTDGPLWIGVWSGNLKAQKLYAAYGFEKAGEYQYPVGAWMDDEFILRRG
jgi:GNAT superfamily N-acetyltransferase